MMRGRVLESSNGSANKRCNNGRQLGLPDDFSHMKRVTSGMPTKSTGVGMAPTRSVPKLKLPLTLVQSAGSITPHLSVSLLWLASLLFAGVCVFTYKVRSLRFFALSLHIPCPVLLQFQDVSGRRESPSIPERHAYPDPVFRVTQFDIGSRS